MNIEIITVVDIDELNVPQALKAEMVKNAIVRCKDCEKTLRDGQDGLWCYREKNMNLVNEDHYCGYGRRK